MTAPVSRRLVRLAGWLLTPFVAWAASFLGAWAGAAMAVGLSGGKAALLWLAGGGIGGAVLGVVGWVWRMRRATRREDPPPPPVTP